MTYHKRELLVSQSSQHQQPHLPRRTLNNSNNRWHSSRLSPSQPVRIECKAEERHCIGDSSSYTINSSSKPIRFTMNHQSKPVHFRSQIIVHNDPEADLHIKRLSVAFHYHDDPPTRGSVNYRPSPPVRSRSLHTPRSSLPQRQQHHQKKDNNSRRKSRPSASPPQSQALLHQWIDDICANKKLMSNNDIVFFIKNGEFFARI
jgi:hypothetical protein